MRSRIAGVRHARDELRQAAGAEMKRRRRIKRKGRRLAGQFVGEAPLRADMRPGGAFIPASARKELAELLRKKRETGLQNLDRDKARPMGIALDDGTIERLGLREGGKAKWSEIERELQPTSKQPGWKDPVQQVIEDCEAQHNRDQEIDGGDIGAGLATATSILIDARPAELSGKVASERIADVLDAALGTANSRPESADIAAALETPVPLGPADVDAYYDYYNLRIAWEDSWTAVGDKNMKDKLAQLYDTVVDIVEFEEEDPEWDFSEIDELHDLLETLEDSVEAAAAAYEPVIDKPTPKLASWMPELADVWHYISDSERRYSELQHDLHEYVLSRTTEAVIENFLSGALSNFFDRKLWKIPPFDEHERDWVPDMKIGQAVYILSTMPNYFRNEVKGQVDFEEARKKKGDADKKVAERDAPYATHAAARLGRAERLIGELKQMLAEPYQFDVFAKGSYNFGLLATYRQRWRPLNYQAGDLAGTLPLAPNEKRSYSVTNTVAGSTKRTRESAFVSETTRDMFSKSRAEGHITDSVKRKISAKFETDVTAKISDYLTFTAGSTLNTEASSDSQRIKKNVREFTDKAVQKYRDENKASVTIENSFESSTTESREISNPNNEITVTYLFYELQRRYEVSERFYDMQPVILVAYDMPRPDEITEAWLLKHDWIIERSLLDRSFLPALSYLSQTFAGDEVSVEVLEQQWKTQLAVVTDLKRQAGAHERLRDVARSAVEKSVMAAAGTSAAGDIFGNGLGFHLSEKLLNAADEVAQTQAENARAALAWADQDLNRIEQIVTESVTALERATTAYVEAIEQRLNRRVQIDRLILHIKENILHYMQSIWTTEHVDQRYLRLYDMDIQWPGDSEVRIESPIAREEWKGSIGRLFGKQRRRRRRARIEPPSFAETKKLHQVADIDRLLGFRGNLAVFPVTKSNALSTYLAQDFLDSESALRDPDDSDDIPTASEAVAIAKCALEKAGDNAEERGRIGNWLVEALRQAHAISRDVIVPTGELFIEALPGAHPLLEDFKLKHRAFDAAKAATDVRTAQMDLIRRAMRLEEGDTQDPDIDKYVRIDGNTTQTFDSGQE
ncbi:MAG: hypothetical protein AAFQ27_14145 [Pseudomonadota bacterium]